MPRSLSVGLLVLAIGCSAAGGPRPILAGAECHRCGMAIQDLHYASEDVRDGRYRFYDSIECLLETPGRGPAWLADYDSRTLHAADSMWVVQANIPSPMGGGLAAFLDSAAAEEIARDRGGRAGRLSEFAGWERGQTGRSR